MGAKNNNPAKEKNSLFFQVNLCQTKIHRHMGGKEAEVQNKGEMDSTAWVIYRKGCLAGEKKKKNTCGPERRE